jgi:hypothetical protein
MDNKDIEKEIESIDIKYEILVNFMHWFIDSVENFEEYIIPNVLYDLREKLYRIDENNDLTYEIPSHRSKSKRVEGFTVTLNDLVVTYCED